MPAKQGAGVSSRDQAQPQFGLMPAARMTPTRASTRRSGRPTRCGYPRLPN